MQKLYFSKDQYQPENLYPFSLTRDVQDIRVGILPMRKKWELLLKNKKINVISESDKEENNAIKIPINIIPTTELINAIEQKKFNLELNNFSKTLEYSWQIFQFNDWAIRQDFELITKGRTSQKISSTNKITGAEIFIEEGANVEHSFLNASTGPIYIGKNVEIMAGCMVRGPFAICEESVLKMGTKIYGGTTIGKKCIVGGEIKNSVIQDYSNKAHDGYLGDSVIGEWCNLGAGTSNSNIKNTAGEVKIWNAYQQKFISAGTKCGLLMGDYSRAAINTSFNTGTVVGVACNIFAEGFPSRYIENFSWGNKDYELEKALQHIDNWKKLKYESLTIEERKILSDIYNQKNKNA